VVLLERGLSLAEIGRRFDRHESTVAYWVRKHGLQPAGRERHAARGGISRERLEQLLREGASTAEMAERLGRSKGTIRHWIGRYGLATIHRPGARPSDEVLAAKAAALASASMRCPAHGVTGFWVDGRGVYRCKLCRAEAVSRRRRKVKATLVAEAGGACSVCGYARSMRALHFHHLDPSEKRLEINARGASLSLERLRAEARKCVLLCSNCHAEVEAGLLALSFPARRGIQ
jgi:transposase